MKSCLINEEDNDGSVILSWESYFIYESSRFCKFFTGDTHEIIGNTRENKEFTLPSRRMHKSIHIVPLISRTMMSERTIAFSLSCPYSANNRLKSYTSFILCPDFYSFSWVFLSGCFCKILEFFLKASCSSGVALFS